MKPPGQGYVTDIPYTRGFYRELAPAWLDFTAEIAGVAPPSHAGDFAWCELGCGQGVTTAVLAAGHPRARFVGIDLMPAHIAHARRLGDEAGIANATFHAADFAAPPPALPQFDYIVAHGVYAWVDAAVQQALLRFVERHLKPGGLLYLSYNAMPGWTAMLPLQRLLLAFARDLPGDSFARFAAAVDVVRGIAAAGAPSLGADVMAEIDHLLAARPPAYLAHEFMSEHWRPRYVTDVRAALQTIGLQPAGSATLADNFDSYVLRGVERDALAAIDDPDCRELARDYLRHARFRRDAFSRGGTEIGDDERRRRLLARRYALARPAETAAYHFDTGAGRLAFVNDTARAIVGGLAGGPRTGVELSAGGFDRQDVVANLMALCSAGAVRPVALEDAAVGALNAAILDRIDGNEAIGVLALACGTAVRLEPAVLRALRDGGPDSGGPDGGGPDSGAAAAQWRRYLRRHGALG